MDADPDAPVLGYTDDWSVIPGDVANFRVSCLGSQYQASIVRIVAGGPRPAGTDSALRYEQVEADCAGSYLAVRRQIVSGSYAECPDVAVPGAARAMTLSAWIFPTLPAASRRQGVVAWRDTSGAGLALEMTGSGHLAAVLGNGASEALSATPLVPYTWYFVAAAAAEGTLSVFQREIRPGRRISPDPAIRSVAIRGGRHGGDGRVMIGAISSGPDRHGAEATVCEGAFNGKIEAPALVSRALTAQELSDLALQPATVIPSLAELVWHADFAGESGQRRGFTLVNSPMRQMTGHSWRGQAQDWRVCPEHYGAIWFHDDDLDDARWPADFSWTVPSGTRSGMYAARLTCEYGEDLVPFYVRAAPGRPSAPLAVWIPTFTYMAYSNHLWDVPGPERGHIPDAAERYVARHREIGCSLYSLHRDGSGIAHVSWRRPMPDVRPDGEGLDARGRRT